MDALTLGTFLSPMFTVTTEWNTGETGYIYDLMIRHEFVINIEGNLDLSYGYNLKPASKNPTL